MPRFSRSRLRADKQEDIGNDGHHQAPEGESDTSVFYTRNGGEKGDAFPAARNRRVDEIAEHAATTTADECFRPELRAPHRIRISTGNERLSLHRGSAGIVIVRIRSVSPVRHAALRKGADFARCLRTESFATPLTRGYGRCRTMRRCNGWSEISRAGYKRRRVPR